jgi:hypothetical protein
VWHKFNHDDALDKPVLVEATPFVHISDDPTDEEIARAEAALEEAD